MSFHNNFNKQGNSNSTPITPQQHAYRLAQNGLKIYQLIPSKDNPDQMQQQRLLYAPATTTTTKKIETATGTTPQKNSSLQNHFIAAHSQSQSHNVFNTMSMSPQTQSKKSNQQMTQHPSPMAQRTPPKAHSYVPSFQPQQQYHLKNTIPIISQNHFNNQLNHVVTNNNRVQHQQVANVSPNFKQIANSTMKIPQQTSLSLKQGKSSSNNHNLGIAKQLGPAVTITKNSGQLQQGNGKQGVSNSGGAARVHQHIINNHVQSPQPQPTNRTKPIQEKVKAATAIKTETFNNKPTPPKSLNNQLIPNVNVKSEPVDLPVKRPRPFQKGDDVLFTTDNGTFMFGTVGMIHGETLQILFGDGTQQLASFSRVKLLSCAVDEEEEQTPLPSTNTNTNSIVTNNVSKPSKSSSKSNLKVQASLASPDPPPSNINEEVTCGSCGVVKKVAGKKALNYAPYTKDQFNCRRCLNKSKFSKNNNIPYITSSHKTKSNTTSPNSPSIKGQDNRRLCGNSGRSEICFHCEKTTNYHDRLHCNLCERACHLSCLAMSPTPLDGDRFWDVICSACGTQNGDSGSSGRSKVFSCRRSISSWSDVAHLVLNCLASQNDRDCERFFDLDNDVIPFIENNLDKLHLPRTYKNASASERRVFINTAFTNATLRFVNGRDLNRPHSEWALRENISSYPQTALPSPAKGKAVKSHSINGARTSLSPICEPKWAQASAPHTINATLASKTKTPSPPKLDSGGSSRTMGVISPKRNISSDMSSMDTLTSTQSSPLKLKISSRVMSQTLVQKAKKQQQMKPQEMLEPANNKKRKSELVVDSTPNKRLKLITPEKVNGVYNKTPSSKSPKDMSEWFLNLKSPLCSQSPSTAKSPKIERESPSVLFGKAVKSAGITPPGLRSHEKPSLRIRKPKSFDLKCLSQKKEKFPMPENDAVPLSTNNKQQFGKIKPNRGKSSKPISNAALQRFSQIPLTNGSIEPEPEVEAAGDFSLLKSPVEDLIKYGSRYAIHCLPKIPETKSENRRLLKLVAQAYNEEENTGRPPAYLKTSTNKGANLKPWEKSKRDLKDLDSYEITGRWFDKNGTIRYYCEWKDGYGNGSDEEDEEEEDSGPIFEFEANESILDDAGQLFDIGDGLEETALTNGTPIPIVLKEEDLVNLDKTIVLMNIKKEAPESNPIKKKEDSDKELIIDLTSDSP